MYYSRSEFRGYKEYVKDHLSAVGRLAEEFASPWGGGLEARIAGLMHDIGKYGDLFRELLQGRTKHVDHWTAGAYLAAKQYGQQAFSIVLAIQGHHIGLMHSDRNRLNDSLLAATSNKPGIRQWAGNPPEELQRRWQEDTEAELPVAFRSARQEHQGFAVAQMLDVRMLFSALVDADWLSAEAHENRDGDGLPVYRANGPAFDVDENLRALEQHLAALRVNTKASEQLQSARDFLFQNCWDAGEQPKGLYTLCAPTGSGKTVATLAFLLRQCKTHGLRRIIVVLPYLSLLDQTANTYREIFKDCGAEYVIEDDSLARDISGSASPNDKNADSSRMRLLAQNWDAPIVVTTTVRFFDSLFSNRSADCRKLHRIASSAVLFDEAQTMPLSLAVPTLAAVAALVRNYGCTVLFSTATQPAFETFSGDVQRFAGVPWAPKAILDGRAAPFQCLRRVQVRYDPTPVSLEDVARQADGLPSALFIVNKKAHAKTLFEALKERGGRTVMHLSTNMCPEHRRETIRRVQAALNGGGCVLAATQCVEAGIDLDFPRLWRALAPLEALCQAAGRCNRNGRSEGLMRVFIPQSDGGRPCPDTVYERGANLVSDMACEAGAFPDIFDPEVIRRYYERLYTRTEGEKNARNYELEKAIVLQDFEVTAKEYHWIDRGGVNILVPYAPCMEQYERLAEAAQRGDTGAAWFREARGLTVSAFLRQDSAAQGWLAPVKHGREEVPNWFVLTNPEWYSEDTGLNLELADDISNFTVGR